MAKSIYISKYDIEDWQTEYACGKNRPSPTICGVPSRVVDRPGVYQVIDGKWVKTS